MKFFDHRIIDINFDSEDVFILKVKPLRGRVLNFKPGQYTRIIIPDHPKTREHFFSFASSPENKSYLEFCIRIYGNWTKALSQLKKGKIIKISSPMGSFIWKNGIRNAVFIVGGIGISPFMSMLRYIVKKNSIEKITLLYGNRTQQTISYKKELEEISKKITLKIIHIFSEEKEKLYIPAYHGFITKKIIEKEIDFSAKPVIFITGPQVFIEKMLPVLGKIADKEKIKFELK
ncbi:MAG: hypothetical protein A3C27_01820 [Candidatus Levybacteria bacterium RIFCSPHIGHO2_02_FULL_39_36]|nr:MAG: Oxidoreductase NAD-binding domain protein [Candidatus Levybacteria bacterium GW2011_GWA1_39_11]KKR26662.1 MAG: hypothetical protein UT57_C0029G0001 [Microgenomates group bacterium GW2011_GWC1_39_7]OGH15244.1 MAG: hypothetical protein A2689_01000 [Candidatus Levybacteria bacterium RIFCSPHIGHO2_01_FULL_38_96]OGH25754.1 MAG: hypothetical protein A3E68_01735 [Candidatus Levybacteria bacterium RIFCSPHIGHO2_12_FULL_39_39]OGH28435.1 MAG: hypothetical protein A3C27_01820 [Candidatus Levybacteri